jgi:hypothetical protein
MRQDLTHGRIRAARLIAAGADLLQLALLPAFFPAVLSPAADVIDLMTAIALVRLVGWHWAFLPTFVAEMLPFVDLVPTWTAAVFLATRHGATVTIAPHEIVVETQARVLDEPGSPGGPGGSGERKGAAIRPGS